MKLTFKIVLVNFLIVLLITALVTFGNNDYAPQSLLIAFGLFSLCGTGISFLIAIVLFLTGPKNKEWAMGFLLSSGLLLLAGLLTCGSSLSTMKTH